MAAGQLRWPARPSFPPRQEAIRFGPKTRTKHRELRGSKTRHSAETLKRSKQAQTYTIIECTTDDVKVLRSVKNRVLTVSKRVN